MLDIAARVMRIGASFALGGFEPALDWMAQYAKPDGITTKVGARLLNRTRRGAMLPF